MRIGASSSGLKSGLEEVPKGAVGEGYCGNKAVGDDSNNTIRERNREGFIAMCSGPIR